MIKKQFQLNHVRNTTFVFNLWRKTKQNLLTKKMPNC